MAKTETAYVRVGIVITRDDENRRLAYQLVQHPAYKDAKRREKAKQDAVTYAITRALEPRSPMTIDWSTSSVFAHEGRSTIKVATFTTEQYQVEQQAMEAA